MTQFLINSSFWIPTYGVLGAAITLPWAVGIIRRSGPRPAAYLNILMTLVACIHSGWLLWAIWDQPPHELLIPWLQTLGLDLSLALSISPVSVGAAFTITGLSLLAQVYALGYLEKDWGLARFYSLMGFFEGAMTGIAISDSLLLSYALLEMLTLSTYLLVGFWYAQPLVVKAARDAFLTKRVGDLFLLMGMIAVTTYSGMINFSDLADWAATATLQPWVATLLGLALIAGPIGKCAQFPLHLWLDEAMEGPNPASILRNSVVVGCGAFVLIKLQPILLLSPVVKVVLITLGAITAIGTSLMAMAQIDLKRALSHTTSAYLGLVFIAVALEQGDLALQLLLTHGMAKAGLFMAVGSLISTTITQDIRQMGGLGSRMPATVSSFGVGALSMLGILPLGSFWVLSEMMTAFRAVHPWLVGIVVVVNLLTALNLTRVYWRVFAGSPQPKSRRAPEVAWPMAVPMVFVVVCNLLMPVLLWQWQLLVIPTDWLLPLLLIGSGLVGLGMGRLYWGMPGVGQWIDSHWGSLEKFLAYDFYIEKLYTVVVVQPFGWASRLVNTFDRYIVDGVVNAVGLVLLAGGEGLKYTISGRLQGYVLTILVGVLLVGSLLLPSLWGLFS